MTQKLENLLQEMLKYPEKVNSVLNDPNYGRKSVREDFDTTDYYAQEAIKAIKHNPRVSIEDMELKPAQDHSEGLDTPKDRSQDPIDAEEFEIPDSWIYDKNYVYNAEDDTYVFMTREFGNIVKSGSWVKNIVQAYSNWDGEQDTINEVCRKFGVTRALFNEIKSILGLTHDHEPFTPEEIREKSSEEMAQEAYQMKRFKTKQKFDKKDWKETQKEAKKWRNLTNSILEEVKLDAPQIVVDPILPTEADIEPDDIVLHTGDWHLGAEAKDLPNIPDFNHEILEAKLSNMVEIVRAEFPESRLHFHFNGDLFETVTGMNHADSWKNIEKGYYGSKVILEGEKLLLNVLSGLRPASARLVTGNHGRLTSDKRKDHSGEGELIVYEHIKQRLDGVDVAYSDTKIEQVIDRMGYQMTHGHLKTTRKSEQNIVQAVMNDFKQPVDFILYEQGHEHERSIKTDNNLFRHLTIPSIFTGHDYNKRNGYGNMSGFVVSYRHPVTQKLKIEDYSV